VEEECIWGFGVKSRRKEPTRNNQTHEDKIEINLRGIE
jgi:hypothetical protein